MAAENSPAVILSERYNDLTNSFKDVSQSLLTACPRKDIDGIFEGFTDSERDAIFATFLSVIKMVPNNTEDNFKRILEEFKVGETLEKIEQIIEEQSLDVLSKNRVDFRELKEKIRQVKLEERDYLKSMLEKVEKNNNEMRSRVEELSKNQDFSTSIKDAAEKMRSWNAEFKKNLGQI